MTRLCALCLAENRASAPASCFPQNLHLGHWTLLLAVLVGVPGHLRGAGGEVSGRATVGASAPWKAPGAGPAQNTRRREAPQGLPDPHLGVTARVTGPEPAPPLPITFSGHPPGPAVPCSLGGAAGTWHPMCPPAGDTTYRPSVLKFAIDMVFHVRDGREQLLHHREPRRREREPVLKPAPTSGGETRRPLEPQRGPDVVGVQPPLGGVPAGDVRK